MAGKGEDGTPSDRREAAAPLGMVVATNPGSSLTAGPELDLVKAALLYGDRITLISPLTTMLLRVESLEGFSPHQLIELIRRVAPILYPAQSASLELGFQEVEKHLRLGGDRRQRVPVLQRLAPTKRVLAETVRQIGHDAGIDQLAQARARGIVQIEDADPGDEMDLLVACIVSAKLAETRERPDHPHTSRVVETFVEKLSKHLSSGNEYLVFDEPIARLTEAAVREGVFSPAKGPAGRSAQAMAASALMGRLPTFPNATVDEVLDIREELRPSLTHFRSSLAAIAKGFSSSAWESDFEDEVNAAWVETVHPALEAIEESVRDNRSLLTLAAGITGAANTTLPGLLIVAAGFQGHAGGLEVLGGSLSVAAPVLQALRAHRDTNASIRMLPFYFLYAVERSLG